MKAAKASRTHPPRAHKRGAPAASPWETASHESREDITLPHASLFVSLVLPLSVPKGGRVEGSRTGLNPETEPMMEKLVVLRWQEEMMVWYEL